MAESKPHTYSRNWEYSIMIKKIYSKKSIIKTSLLTSYMTYSITKVPGVK